MSTSYLSQLQALQPPGAALPRDPGSVWYRLLTALAEELERVESRSVDLTREADPRTTIEMLEDWERVCGLPGECPVRDTASSLQARRAAVVNVLTRAGGATLAYFKRLTQIAGVEIDITEYRPFLCGLSFCGGTLWGTNPDPHGVRHVWQVLVKGQRVTRFRCGASTCGERLCAIDPAEELECLLRQAAPAHTVLLVGYE